MDKKEFLNSPNITDLIKTIVNKLCSEEVFKSDSKVCLRKYESSMKKINFILVDGLGSKNIENLDNILTQNQTCLLYTSPSPRDATLSRMPSSA